MARFFVGVDLGQAQDYTAIAVLERAELVGEWDPVMFANRKSTILRVRHLERVELGTPYPEVVRRVRDVARAPDLEGRCRLVADATGVGRPVVDMLRRSGLGCQVYPVMITGGHFETSEQGTIGCRSGT